MNYKELYKNDTDTQKICKKVKCADDLIKGYYHQNFGHHKTIAQRRYDKIMNSWGWVELKGHGLELAFGLGTSLYWLTQEYPNITLDGIDFAKHYKKILKPMKEISDRIKSLFIGDISDMSFIDDDTYDFINSCSVFEHLPDEEYHKSLRECYRILKPNGLIGVYVDQTSGIQHIRVVKPEQTQKEMESVGFKAITPYLYTKVEK